MTKPKTRFAMTMTACSRPNYLAETLESLAANQHLDNFTLHFGVEPVNQEVLQICSGVRFMDTDVHVNETRLGVRENPHQLLKRTFDLGYEGVLYLEDDVILSPDAVDLVLHYANSEEAERHRCLCLHNIDSQADADPTRIETDVDVKKLEPLGFYASSRNWVDFIAPMWHASFDGWDWSLRRSGDHNRIARPAISRSHHIGLFGGVHYDVQQPYNSLYANNPYYHGRRPDAYRFVGA